MAKRTLSIPIRKVAAPGPGFWFADLEPQTPRQWLHIQYAQMYRHQLMGRVGLNRGMATAKARQLLTDLDSGRRQITDFPSAAAEKRKREGRCAYCGDPAANSTDHLIPRLRGGPEDADNHVPACRRCNASKGSKDVFEWAESKGFFPLEVTKRYIRLAYRWTERNGLLDSPLASLWAAGPPFGREIPWSNDWPLKRPRKTGAHVENSATS